MKSFDYFKPEKPKQPVPPCTIPIAPGGINILRSMYESAGKPFNFNPLSRRFPVSNYGIDLKFRDFMFSNYGAEIVKHDGSTMIRFIDEQMMLMFVLKYGA